MRVNPIGPMEANFTRQTESAVNNLDKTKRQYEIGSDVDFFA